MEPASATGEGEESGEVASEAVSVGARLSGGGAEGLGVASSVGGGTGAASGDAGAAEALSDGKGLGGVGVFAVDTSPVGTSPEGEG